MNIPLQIPTAIAFPSDQDSTGRTLGEEEIHLISEAIRSGTLTATKGQFTKELESAFAKQVGAKYAYACSSGSAAVHCAIAAIDPEPGDEIITTSITDMGALTPILFHGAIPVFADVESRSGNVTARSIAERITPRTKAIIVTHLFGNPCHMTSILAVANKHHLPVIEDSAQAFDATHAGRSIGTLGKIGCFSLQQGKHITTGEGGLIVTDDPDLARKMFLFLNKSWGYGDAKPDHYSIGLNYRLSELQSACAVAQLPKLASVVQARQETAKRMDDLLADIPGIRTPYRTPNSTSVYWKYSILVDPEVIPGGPSALGAQLKLANILSAPRYIQKPAFRCEIFREQRTFGNSRWPFTLATPEAVNYSAERFPGSFAYLDRVLVLPWNEKYTDDHLNYLASSIFHAAKTLVEGKVS